MARRTALNGLAPGRILVYDSPQGHKWCTCGKVVLLSELERTISVHRHIPVADSRLRVRWTQICVGLDGEESIGAGTRPALEVVATNRALRVMDFVDGGLPHQLARLYWTSKDGASGCRTQIAYRRCP